MKTASITLALLLAAALASPAPGIPAGAPQIGVGVQYPEMRWQVNGGPWKDQTFYVGEFQHLVTNVWEFQVTITVDLEMGHGWSIYLSAYDQDRNPLTDCIGLRDGQTLNIYLQSGHYLAGAAVRELLTAPDPACAG